MIVITDSNIVFSALKTPNGVVAKILSEKSNIQFYAPSYLIDEVKKHSGTISENKKEVLQRLKILLERIEIIDVDEIPKKKVLEAIEIVKDIDIDDAFFVALYLFKKHKIWTSDKVLIKGLESKGYKICITTSELKQNYTRSNSYKTKPMSLSCYGFCVLKSTLNLYRVNPFTCLEQTANGKQFRIS